MTATVLQLRPASKTAQRNFSYRVFDGRSAEMHLMRKMRDRLLQGLVEPIPPYAAALAERCAYVQLTLLRLDQKGLSRKRGLAPSELRLYGALSGQYARMAKEISQLTPAAPRGPTLAEIFAEEGAA